MEELYTLTIDLQSGAYAKGPWKRVIEVPATTDLYDLHRFIQNIIEFDNDHLFEFFAGRNWRNRKRVFGDDDEFGFEKREGLDTMLNEVFPLGRFKLHYHFDFGDSWIFAIRRERKKKYVDKKLEYPRVIEAEGENPEQYPSSGLY
jgi:Plasmid pRiA4b ORF-3-like protein